MLNMKPIPPFLTGIVIGYAAMLLYILWTT